MPSELALDDKQRAAFDRYVAAIRGRTENMRQQVAPLYAAAWEEMAKPQADPAEVKRLFDEVGVKRQASQRESVGQTLEFLATLSPEQRRNFVTLMRQRWSSRRTR
jgi:Spy/CpxP family protein refolding chaperone